MKETPRPAKGLRRLSDDEITLWLAVTRSVTPRKESVLPQPAEPPAKLAAAPAAVTPPALPGRPGSDATSRVLLPRLAPLERKLRQRLSRGQVEVDAAIDLHGLTQQEAHAALSRFLARAQTNGAKLVLVVTGKGERRGGDDYGAGGVLRRSVPLWLKAAEWRSLIIGFEEAARPHGGAGALYVRLRRRDRPEHDDILGRRSPT